MKTTLSKLKQVKETSYELALRAENAKLRREYERMRRTIGATQLILERTTQAVLNSEPLPKFDFKVPKCGSVAVPFFKLSDWQIGEVISEKETEFFSKFNLEIARNRMLSITEDFLRYVTVQREAYKITECHISCEGDFISGDIHDELSRTNEFPIPVQAAEAGILLGEVLRIISPHFKVVYVHENKADNHGRLVKKPQAKECGLNNMNYLVYAIANAKIARCNNIVINETDAAKMIIDVAGWKFLQEHGNSCKSWMGVPYYGIEREVGREARKRMMTAQGFHYVTVGHWHVPAILNNTVFVNGCLCGTTEFDHIQGRFAAPSQVAFLVSPKHGHFNWTAFRGPE